MNYTKEFAKGIYYQWMKLVTLYMSVIYFTFFEI